MSKVYCGECGVQNDETAGFCGNCGTKILASQPAPVQKTQNFQQPMNNYQKPAQPPVQQPQQGYQQTPAQGYQQPQQGNYQPPQTYQQPQGGYQPPAMQLARKDPGVGYLGTFFIPGFAHFYTDKAGAGVLYTLLTWFLYAFIVGIVLHIGLFLNSGNEVKNYNRRIGYQE